MESQNNPAITKPSKRFLIRGGIATGVLALILVIQTQWFLGLFSKKDTAGLAVSDATVGDVLSKDSNGNGIADWEERLWGLDPTVATTNGVSNKTIIEEKRRSLQSSENLTTLNETDKLARELFGFTAALGQEASIDNSSLGALAAKLGQEGPEPDLLPSYTIKNIKTNQTTRKNLVAYEQSLSLVLSSYNTNLVEIDAFISSIETGDYSKLEDLDTTISFYSDFAKKLTKITVPVGVAQYHLDLTNSVAGMGKSFQKMKLLEDNGIQALVGFSEYRFHDAKLTKAIDDLTAYFAQYGILQ